MSYLDTPRLVFSGQFQADPSTVNNDPFHFDTARFRSSYQLLQSGSGANGWWNPRGSGAWRFYNCTVQRVYYRDGTSCDDSNSDPIIGAALNGDDARVEAKIVDLDPEQQGVSEIWGFKVVLNLPDAPGSDLGFRGDFTVAPFGDLWFARYPAGGGNSTAAAFYQSVLTPLEWSGTGGSRFLKELLADGAAPSTLSIKFVVDGYQDTQGVASFSLGRVVGAIGLAGAREPARFLAGRALLPASPASPLNTAYAQIDGNVLAIDLGNSLPTASLGGKFADLGRLAVAVLKPPVAPQTQPVVQVLTEIPDYHKDGWYPRTAGIFSFRLGPDQLKDAADLPLAIIQTTAQGTGPVLAESSNGIWVRADAFVFRLDPGESASTTLYATQFGRPTAGQTIGFALDPTTLLGQATQGPVPGPQDVGVPQSALIFPASVTTGSDGTATVELIAKDPGNPRKYIDGQVYCVTYGAGGAPPPGTVQNNSLTLNPLVFSGHPVPDQPTWLRDVLPIFQQYADLYPVMKPILDLSDYASVAKRRGLIRQVFQVPISDPNSMPVTRDLSGGKRSMLLKWLDRPVYMELNSAEDLLTALQLAIEVEHSTIPPYLCALYSLKPGCNVEVTELLRSVVVEEMYHMALASNLLVSVGGSPRIGSPRFMPRYPAPMPAGLRGGLTVRLRRCSIAQIRDVFMAIEDPQKTIEPVHYRVRPGDPVETNRFTIAWFYKEVERALVELSGDGRIHFGNAERQVSGWPGQDRLVLEPITSLDGALKAINEILEQGAGKSPTDPYDGEHELAHYFKFSEIVQGRRLVRGRSGFTYDGEAIPFDSEGVYPMMDDPDIGRFAPDSRAYMLSVQFAESYQALLTGLHRTFNGEPGHLRQAIGAMFSLDLLARDLMQTPSGLADGTTAGPSFQLPFPK